MATGAKAKASFEKKLCAAVMNDKGKEKVKKLLTNYPNKLETVSSREIPALYFQILKFRRHGQKFLISQQRADLLNRTICNAKEKWLSCEKKEYYTVDEQMDKEDILCDIGELLEYLLKDNAMNFYKSGIKDGWIIRDLFIWTVLAGKWEMSQILLGFGKHQIGSALIGCALSKALAEKAERVGDLQLSQDLKTDEGRYEKMSVDTVAKCYQENKRLAHKLLVRKMEAYEKNTLFTISNSYAIKPFMGTACCQTKLNKLWTGHIAPHTPQWKIILGYVLPFFIPFMTFKETRGDKKVKGQEHDGTDEEVRNVEPDESNLRKICEKLKLGTFYNFYRSPVVKYISYSVSYWIFLAFFALFVLTDLRPDNVSPWEIITWIWIFTFAVDEVRQIWMISKGSLCFKVKKWSESIWNCVDLFMYLSCPVAVIVRTQIENFAAVRFIYSIILAIFIIRMIEGFMVSKWIGPKVIVLGKMFKDVVVFVGIFLVFLVSFGVMYQANLYPNSLLDWHLLKGIFYIPYWQLFGELFLDELKGEHDGMCTTDENVWRENDGHGRCPEQSVEVFAAVYLFLSTLLLVNILIAMFNYTYTDIHSRSEEYWRFYFYGIVRTVYDFPFLCPPFNIIFNIHRMVCRRCKITGKHAFYKNYKGADKLDKFERKQFNKIYQGAGLDMTKTAGSGAQSKAKPEKPHPATDEIREMTVISQ